MSKKYSVQDVGKEEETLFDKMPKYGHVEEKDAYLKEHGLYDAWREIYSKYVTLAQEGDLEALKRALFYAWYQFSEPCWSSGIKDLPDSQTEIVVDLLEKYLEWNEDKELKYMLSYYMTICSYYLDRFYPLPNIESVSRENYWNKQLPSSSNWSYRGQMGDYWG